MKKNLSTRTKQFAYGTLVGLILFSTFVGLVDNLLQGRVYAAPSPVAMLNRNDGFQENNISDYPASNIDKLPMSGCVAHFADYSMTASNFTKQIGVDTTFFRDAANQNVPLPSDISPQVLIGGLNGTQIKYIFKNFNNTVQSIQFTDSQAGTTSPGPKCVDFVLIPVSDTEWRGFQYSDQCSGLGGCIGNPNHYMTFKNPTTAASGEKTGTFIYNERVHTNSLYQINEKTLSAFIITGTATAPPPPGGGGGGPVDCSTTVTTNCVDRSKNPPVWVCGDGSTVPFAQGAVGACGTLAGGGAVNGSWQNISQITLANGEVFQKLKWDNKNYFFLTQTSDTARQALTWSTAQHKETDPLADTLKIHCVPYFHITPSKYDVSFFNHDTGRLQQNIDGFGSKRGNDTETVTYFDVVPATDPNLECNKVSNGDGVQASITGTPSGPQTWFYYDKVSDSFKTLFQDGDGYEKPYLGTYVKDTRVGVTTEQYVFSGGTATSCKWLLYPQGDWKSATTFNVKWELRDSGCQDPNTYGTITVLAKAVDQATFGGIAAPGTGNGPITDTTPLGLDCKWSWNPFKLSWLICPLIDLAKGAVDILDKNIQDQLKVDVLATFGSTSMEKAWSGFRTVAFSLLGLIGLIMILSQAFSFGPFDAYTIKKVLPRMVIAVIAISLSWQIMQILVTISNDVGGGVGGLISSPFKQGYGNATFSSTGLGGVGLGIAGVALGALGLLSLAVTAMLAVVVAFVTITFRSMFLMLLIIMSPVAIIAWILPGTQKAWKFWSSNLTSVLLAYPIIVAFITIGRVFATVTTNGTGDGGDFIHQIMAFIAYFGPYFMLPAAFRLAGGVMASASGAINGKAENGFAGLKKYRGGKFAENRGKLKAGNRFSDRNPLARGFNRTSVGLGTGVKGRFGLGVRGNQAIDQARRSAVPDLMKSHQFAGVANNDDALMAATYDTAADAQAALTARWGDAERARRAVAATQASIGFGRPQALAAAQQLVSTGTGYQTHVNAAGQTVTGIEDMAQTLARASGGNANSASALAGFANSETKKVGRNDLAPGFKNLDLMVRDRGGMLRNDETGVSQEAANQAAWNSASLYTVANGKRTGTQTFADHWVNEYQQALDSGDTERMIRAKTARLEFKNMLPNASGDNQEVITQALASMDFADQEQQDYYNTLSPADLANVDRNMQLIDNAAQKQARVYDPRDREIPDRGGAGP